jgi:hypothetical protein
MYVFVVFGFMSYQRANINEGGNPKISSKNPNNTKSPIL